MDDAREFNPAVGEAQEVGPNIRRILAPNPSPMTFRGTNTYLVGDRQIAVIDPGPDDTGHLAAILAALRPGDVVVTMSSGSFDGLPHRLLERLG